MVAPQTALTRSGPLSRRLVLVVGFAALAFVLTAVVGGIWSALLTINLATSPAIPWAVVVMALLLWLLWRYLGGAGWPRGTAEARRQHLRARRVAGRVFLWAVGAGLLAIVALAGLWFVLFQLAHLPPTRALPNYSRYPLSTVALALVMGSRVGAVAEESAFRGYLQGILEGTVGGVAAILITALVMAPEHAQTQGFVWPTLLFYIVVDVMLGATALLTQSVLPGIVTHSIGLLVFFTLVWPGDVIRQAIGGGTTDLWFGLHGAQTVVFAVLATLAFIHLARVSRQPQGA
ncbi:MAG TPA: CPBP family intramembrane glutamic endopeptidase [Ktedonobacterales bacterium]|nr:CPBP family intramembrane glutamic endopeptidase [Ktedonobacterales bacterium]